MKPIRSVAALYGELRNLQRNAATYCTNLFPDPRKLQLWIERDELSHLTTDKAVLFFRKDRGFSHLYFCAAGLEALTASLQEFGSEPLTLVADLIGREDDVSVLTAAFRESGFRQYASLRRMVRVTGKPASPAPCDSDVVFAAAEDAQRIAEVLATSFDWYAEQIPTLAEVEAAVASRNILVVRRGAIMAGLLFYEVTGYTSILRYWFVGQQYRNRGIGSSLMQAYFRECAGVKRFILWAMVTNDNAAKRYRHHGFGRDNLVDQVVLRERVAP